VLQAINSRSESIYEFLETTVDRCEDVADALENIAAKKC
jgi:uncharacterized protein Yka (UPF0111/DUF47 family)